MIMNTKTKRTRIIEKIKSLILTLLLISLIALVAVYVGGTRFYESVAAKGQLGSDFDKLWSVQSDVSPEGLDFSRLLPEFIGYKQASSSELRASVGHYDSISALYKLAKPCILELFGKDSLCRQLSQTDGKARFGAAMKSSEFIFLRYHTPVLYQIIYAYAADQLTVSEDDVATGISGSIGAYVRDLIILPDKDFAAKRYVAYACDKDGNYYEFRPNEHFVSSEFDISQLSGGGLAIAEYNFKFAEDERFIGAQPFVGGVEAACISLEPSEFTDENVRTELIRLFEYNLDKLDGYADNDSYVYVDTHSQLRIGSDTVSFYTHDATDENSLRGISIESLLGYTVSDASGLFDKLTAIDTLIRRLESISEGLVGGEASLCLGDVYSDDALLVVEYFLTYNGIRIGTEPYLRAVLTEKTLCELVIHPVTIRALDTAEFSLPSAFVFEKLDKMGKLGENAEIDSISLRYGERQADWVLVTAK